METFYKNRALPGCPGFGFFLASTKLAQMHSRKTAAHLADIVAILFVSSMCLTKPSNWHPAHANGMVHVYYSGKIRVLEREKAETTSATHFVPKRRRL